MPDNLLDSVFDLPDVSFIDNDSLEAIMSRLVSNYEKKYQEVTGQAVSLGAADAARIQLYAVALDLYQIEQYIDRAGKQDLLKYSYGEYLDNLAGGRGVTRHPATAARTTMRFTLSDIRPHTVGIPAGIRVTNGDGLYFQTPAYAEIPAGNKYADVEAVCTSTGTAGNDFLPGQINILADPLPYVESVENITTTANGTDLEDDLSLAERTYLSPSSYSVAGPDDAYIYWSRTYNTDIGSVRATSPTPCIVIIYILMRDGSMPAEEVIQGLTQYLKDEKIRPLTDKVEVKAPTEKPFDLELTYYINRSNQASAYMIQNRVEEAVQNFISWQTTEIGRDINPSELIRRIREAGAKRVNVISPPFSQVGDTEVARLSQRIVTYGGLEND